MKTRHQIYKTLCIDITTYKYSLNRHYTSNHIDNSMIIASLNKHDRTQNKFICSICLNQKCESDDKESEHSERKSRSCPICLCSCSCSTDNNSALPKRPKEFKNNINVVKDIQGTKDVENSHADVTQGLTLLNEVLNVFQNKKQLIESMQRKSKTIILKDVGVLTEDSKVYYNTTSKLSRSKIFHYSIEDKIGNEHKFTIVSSCQPERIFATSHNSLDLINHKSSSIPQMKMEELKKSLKKKTKSKDAIEEANRMFATMKKVEEKDSYNRPMIRNGPRVLPVVKTGNFEDNQKSIHNPYNKTCKVAQENNYYMSSGDSDMKNKCCHNCNRFSERCDDSMHMMCCHHQKDRQQTKSLICKRCRLAAE